MPNSKTQQNKLSINHYQVLGISPRATKKQIKTAFYKLAKLHHPDSQNPSSGENDSAHHINHSQSTYNPDKFHQISEAYSVLIDNKKRQQYNQMLILKQKTHKQKQLLKQSISIDRPQHARKKQNTTNSSFLSSRKKCLSFIVLCCAIFISFIVYYLNIVTSNHQQHSEQAITNPNSTNYMLYPQERLHANYSLINGLNVYQHNSLDSKILTKLEKYHTVFSNSTPQNGWLKIQTSQELSGYVLEKYLGFGDGEFAKKIQCDAYPSFRPSNITLLQKHYGKSSLIIHNNRNRDMLFQLKDQSKRTILIAYVQGNTKTTLQNLPKGRYFAEKIFGTVFNHRCHTFMKNRELILYKSPVII